MKLYHTGKEEIRCPDIRRGRKNADFGQGFYLTPDRDFAYRWAGSDAVLNEYELDESGLSIRRFSRDEEWFDYIYRNRRARDRLTADIVIGPIANDTIFDTFGIVSSGFLKPADALKLLMVGPEYTQVAVKTEKAASRLQWIRSSGIARMESSCRKAEQDAYDASIIPFTSTKSENDGMTANRATRKSRSHVDGANRLHHEQNAHRGSF